MTAVELEYLGGPAIVEPALSDDEILNAVEAGLIAAGVKPGRESAEQTILFWHRGLATSDIAPGAYMLEKARGKGLVTRLPYA